MLASSAVSEVAHMSLQSASEGNREENDKISYESVTHYIGQDHLETKESSQPRLFFLFSHKCLFHSTRAANHLENVAKGTKIRMLFDVDLYALSIQ